MQALRAARQDGDLFLTAEATQAAGAALAMGEQHAEAAELLRDAVTVYAELSGRMARGAGSAAQSARGAEAVVQPRHAQALLRLGQALRGAGDGDGAIVALRQALELAAAAGEAPFAAGVATRTRKALASALCQQDLTPEMLGETLALSTAAVAGHEAEVAAVAEGSEGCAEMHESLAAARLLQGLLLDAAGRPAEAAEVHAKVIAHYRAGDGDEERLARLCAQLERRVRPALHAPAPPPS